MSPPEWTIEELHIHLQAALELELLTIPAYLTALYSLRPPHNQEASLIIRSVVVEEMLHMTLAANVLNAVGGQPDIVGGGYVPRYPARIPFHEPESFEVGLMPFGDEGLDVFLAIENPSYPVRGLLAASASAALPRATELARDNGYRTIGDFYRAIECALKELNDRIPALFNGPLERQVGTEHYYASGGDVVMVHDLESALQALGQIIEQGEGEVTQPASGEKFDPAHDLAHYYRFNELRHRRRYQPDDAPSQPTGATIALDLDAVYPMKPNLRTAELGGQVRDRAVAFNVTYGRLLEQVQTAFTGHPERLAAAVATMFELKYSACDLLRIPLEDESGLHAGPTFEWPLPGDSS